jgi:hypothetical protein
MTHLNQVAWEKDKEKEEARKNFRQSSRREDAFTANKREEEDYKNHSWGAKRTDNADVAAKDEQQGPKEEKNYSLSGLLAKETRLFQVCACL